MGFKIFFTERAQRNIDEAIDFYEFKSENLGYRFYSDVTETLKYIMANPELFPVKEAPFRECPLSTFPFVIIYDFFDDVIVIASVFNTSKNPGKKPLKF